MRRSSIWCVSVLFVSAFLLSYARTVTFAATSQSNQRTQTQNEPQQNGSAPSPLASAFVQPSPAPSAEDRKAETEAQSYPASPSENRLPAWLEAIATILLVGFAAWQMRFIRRSTAATENAANAASDNAKAARDAAVAAERYVEMTEQMVEAAKQSARAAELALNVERPYVFVESQTLDFAKVSQTPVPPLIAAAVPGFTKEPEQRIDIEISFTLRNRGKGIAVLTGVRTRLILTNDPLGLAAHFKLATACSSRMRIRQRVIGAVDEYPVRTYLHLPIPVWEGIVNEFKVGLLVVGIVCYHDVFRRPYKTYFSFDYNPPAPAILVSPDSPVLFPKGFLALGRERHNRYT